MSAAPHGVYTIAPGRAFLTDLAEGLVARFAKDGDPLALADATIFLPTRRAARALAEALTKAMNRDAVVLPRIVTLGDVDEDEAFFRPGDLAETRDAIPRLDRELILAGLVDRYRETLDSAGGYAVSLALARALARLIDEAANEDVALDGIADVVGEDLAEHWQRTLGFLTIVTAAWPQFLAAHGKLDPVARRNALIRAEAMRLAAGRPSGIFIAAGSSGSVKASADLLKVIASLPNGAVVLDGLDTGMEDASWEVLPPSHPQFALKELMIHLGVDRQAVGGWTLDGTLPGFSPRARLLSEAMRPPATADAWAGKARAETETLKAGVTGLSVVEAANEREEALTIALAMRRTLETPGARAALVTHDRMLARRVSAELRRWGVEADDSAGLPLAKTEAGSLMRLALEAANGGTALALMSLLKHPRVCLGKPRAAVLSDARQFEKHVLRKKRITGGIGAARAAVEADLQWDGRAAALKLLDGVEAALAPLTILGDGQHDVATFAKAQSDALEKLTRDERGRTTAWAGADGEIAFALMSELQAVTDAAPVSFFAYGVVSDSAARQAPVRPQGPRHPRLSIWGPLEARLQSADLIILGGLNEGVWPANPADDPWLSRPMREALKLSAPERRIGLAAHDFTAMAAQPAVLLTRARRKDGAPSSPSRFLLRLDALARGAGTPLPRETELVRLAQTMDAPKAVVPASRPEPRPPVAARPRKLSVTKIELWRRDPYAIYAQQILKLKPLEKLEQGLDVRDRGTIIHKAAELYALMDDAARGDPYDDLLAKGREAFGAHLNDPDVRAFWWPRFERAARWLAAREVKWAADRVGRSIVETPGAYAVPGMDFTLTGTPDRIDRLKDGTIRVIDYKTGTPPTANQAAAFLAPQLPLLALMAGAGAFGPQAKAAPSALLYAHISGGRKPGKLTALESPAELTAQIALRLSEQIALYQDEDTPFASRAGMEQQRYEGDYDHLARLGEWGDDGEGEG